MNRGMSILNACILSLQHTFLFLCTRGSTVLFTCEYMYTDTICSVDMHVLSYLVCNINKISSSPLPPLSRRKVAVNSVDPRIHFALVCGAKSCPPIRTYSASV